MRISPELIEESEQRLNPCGDSVLVMRGKKIPEIEQLEATRDSFACIDLTDNDIDRIPIMTNMTRLRTLLLGNNVISQIHPLAFASLPNLTSVVLSSNKVARLSELFAFAKTKNLERLSLADNPVTKEPHYRALVIHIVQYSLKFRYLDFERITQTERDEAKAFFASPTGIELLKRVTPTSVNTSATQESTHSPGNVAKQAIGFSPDIMAKMQKALVAATDLEQVSVLETALKRGELTKDAEELIRDM
jgi:U2 small nuclear ribonucleoprotein A'